MRVLPFFKGGPHLGHKKILSIKKSFLVINLTVLRSVHNHALLLKTLLGHLAQSRFTEKDSPVNVLHLSPQCLFFAQEFPSKLLGLIEANTSLKSGMDTNTNNDERDHSYWCL